MCSEPVVEAPQVMKFDVRGSDRQRTRRVKSRRVFGMLLQHHGNARGPPSQRRA
jgi:hypothetical protein